MLRAVGAAAAAPCARAASASPDFVFATWFVLLYLLDVLFIRALDYAVLVRSGSVPFQILGPPLSLPFLLGEDLLVGLALGGLGWLAHRRAASRAAWLAAIGAYLLFLAADQMAFKYFFAHLDLSLYRECHDLASLSSSIAASADGSFLAASACAVAITVLLAIPRRPAAVARLAAMVAGRPVAAALIGVVYLGAGQILGCAAEQHGLEQSLAGAVIATISTQEEGDEAEPAAALPPAASRPPAAVQSTAPPEALAAVRQAIASYAGKLNVVYYILESTPFRESSMSGKAGYDTTPFLAELARDGLLFQSYYTVFPGSTRGDYTSATGLYPYLDQASDIGRYAEIPVTSLPDVLHDEGYRTALFSSSNTWFDSFDSFLGRRAFDHYFDVHALPEGALGGPATSFWGVDEEIAVDRALEWIAAARADGVPFFVNYVSAFPHHPYKVPRRAEAVVRGDFGRDEWKSRYRASLRYADSAIRRFYEGLVRLGVAEDTLFVVSPDHGEAFGDLHAKNRLHAERVYEENTHVFLLLHNRKALGPAHASARVGSQIDLLPTILDILRIRRDLAVDGRSLVADPYEERPLYFVSRTQYGYREGRHKAVWFRKSARTELYDLVDDPDEQKDIAAGQEELTAAFRARFHSWKTRVEGEYRARLAATGLGEQEVRARNTAVRKERFGERESPIRDVAVRPATRPSGGSRFSVGSPVVVDIFWKKPGNYHVQVKVLDADDIPIFDKGYHFLDAGGSSALELPGRLFSRSGRYQVRTILKDYKVIADVKNRVIEVGGASGPP